MSRTRLAVIATHPIQYQAPIWSALAKSSLIHPKVFFATESGHKPYYDVNLRETVQWDLPLLEGYEYEFLQSRKLRGLSDTPAAYWPAKLSEKLQTGEIQCVLVHGYSSGSALAGIAAAKRAGTRLVMRGESHLREARSYLSTAAKSLALPFVLRRVDGFLAIGSWNRAYWLHYGVPDSKIETAYYSIDNDRFAHGAAALSTTASMLREKWGATTGQVVFLFCAKLTPIKNPDLLLGAFRKLPYERTRLVFLGTGELDSRLKREAAGLTNVFFEGFVNQSELPAFYAAADITVLPSEREPWGLVVNESLACGTPVIASDVVGSGPDLIEQFGAGATFARGDHDALLTQLRRALNERVRCEWASKATDAARAASIENFVAGLERVVEKVCLRRSSL
ncbi:MAG: glycosyltransferase family 4 protein [Thermoanaerobaculia bacterium]